MDSFGQIFSFIICVKAGHYLSAAFYEIEKACSVVEIRGFGYTFGKCVESLWSILYRQMGPIFGVQS